MIRIPLYNSGGYALIDDCDAHLALLSWREDRYQDSRYVAHTVERGKHVRLHRVVMGVSSPRVLVDHANGDGLDCRRFNLRLTDKVGNGANTPAGRRNTSGYKGVQWNKKSQNWRARVTHLNRGIEVGSFPTAEAAARAYDEVVRGLFGEFAAVNFPHEGERPARRTA